MQVDLAALGAAGIRRDHPLDHDVDVRKLTAPLAIIARAAAAAGDLSCYTAFGTGLWVSRAQLAAVAGFGRKLYDPRDPCFVPSDAMLSVPYLPALVTDAVADKDPAQRRFRETARYAAAYLAALRQAMPPRPYDLHVHAGAEGTSPLVRHIAGGTVASHPSDRGWWISTADVIALLPAGESIDDPESAWFVGPRDRADHDEVDRFSEAHRRAWPELYAGDLPGTSRVAASV